MGTWRAATLAMRIPLLIFAVSTAAALQLEPFVDKVAEVLTARAKAAVRFDSKVASLRRELAEVQMEMMDVMRPDAGTLAQLRDKERCLKYALRVEEIRLSEVSVGTPRS